MWGCQSRQPAAFQAAGRRIRKRGLIGTGIVFELAGPISEIEEIASGSSIRNRARLEKVYGRGRWRKMKGVARTEPGKRTTPAEVPWYEAHGIGREEIKVKCILD
jgi:hypothetical protein